MNAIDAAELFAPAALEDPYPLYARMRAGGPVCALRGTRAFYVAGHAAVEEAVRRHDVFSAQLTGVLLHDADGGVRLFELGGSGTANEVIATADEPGHAVQRRLLVPPLRAARIESMESAIRTFARERVAAFVAAGGGDWCEAVAEPVPAFVVTQLLALGAEHLQTVRRWAMTGGDLLGGLVDAAGMQALLRETGAMTAFLARHFDAFSAPTSPAGRASTRTAGASAAAPTLMQALAGGVRERAITREQAIGILVILFGAAGESTAALLGNAVWLMLRTPGLQQRLRAQPVLLERFIEEAIRLESPFRFHYRVVKQATTLCDTPLAAGDRLLLGWGSANRDVAILVDPDSLRLDRVQPQRHLGFGHGIHFCIGAPLARLEARVVLEELLAATRHLEPEGQAVQHPGIFVRRLQRFAVRVR
jgi:hypothetical protein